MDALQMTELDRLVSKAGQALFDSQASLKEALNESTPLDPSDESTMHGANRLQLILQYRLDTQDTLAKLLQIDHGLLQILGVEPQHSSKINIERMRFALGQDDLSHVLYSLSQLVHSLMLIANRYRENQSKFAQQKSNQLSQRATTSHLKVTGHLQKAVTLQRLFIASLTEISNTLDEGNKTAEIGPVLVHISALRGPVSQFYQAVQNGLELTHDLYEKTYETVELDNTLEELLHQAGDVLKQIPPMYQPQHFFSPAKEACEDQLENKASSKRLKQFFHH